MNTRAFQRSVYEAMTGHPGLMARVTGIYDTLAKGDTTYPYAVVTFIDAAPIYNQDADLNTLRFQVDIYDESGSSAPAEIAMELAESALHRQILTDDTGYYLDAKPIAQGMTKMRDPDDEDVWRITEDFIILLEAA